MRNPKLEKFKISGLKRPQRSNLADINRLLRQLSSSSRRLSWKNLNKIVRDKNTLLLVARAENGKIIGTATLLFVLRPGRYTAYVEDVVVDKDYRGYGLGRKLMRMLVEKAKKEGVGVIQLTSRPHRVVAHKLYKGLGFKRVDTCVFRLQIDV